MKRLLWESKYAKATEPPIPVVRFVFFVQDETDETSNYSATHIQLRIGYHKTYLW